MTPISYAEQIGWQRRAHLLLGKLLERAAKEGLPPIRWSVIPSGATLHGEISSFSTRNASGTYAAWRDAIGVPEKEAEPVNRQGETRLTAVWEHIERVQVVLTASIWDDEPAGE